ncbi:uncharacterized protein LOC128370914 [Scomber scombrus]|uniref:Uncharacterized protein LOC128370914 n=1 Tax=Scomber scombrus TaxID=13677 RepID=A0AAV1N4F7_SCOSC
MTDCFTELVGLVVLSLALLISLCLNVIFCVRRTASFCRGGCWHRHTSEGESPSQNEGRYIHNLNHHEQQEDANNHCEEQENPIYGNISTDRTGSSEVCYEMMTMKPTRDRMKSPESDLNYASLDLKMAKKRKKKYRQQQGQNQGRNKQDRLSVHLTHPVNAFMEVEADMDAHLPPRDTSTMVSHSSIYLNSQQIAQETEDMERERSIEKESMGWDGIGRREDGESREWEEEQESEERTDRQNNGSVCTQLPQVEAIQSDTDHLIANFSIDNDQQD